MRYAMVENVLIFVIHSFLATTVGIAANTTGQRLEGMSGSRSSRVDRLRPEYNTPHMPHPTILGEDLRDRQAF